MLKPYPGPRSPQVDTIWVIVPFSRPEQAARVRDNFARQRFPGKKLLIVGNGRLGNAGTLSIGGAHWISSGEHQSLAKNEAIAFIKKQGGGFFATMDDDDWYGPGYLDELAGYAKSYDALGKRRHFVSLGDDLSGTDALPPQLLLCNRRYADSEDAAWLTGGTISGWAETAAEFPMMKEAEDLAWCDRMHQKGARLRGLSIYHYLYRRSYAGAKHTYVRDRGKFIEGLKNHDALELSTLPEGGEVDLGIVTGEKAPEYCRVLGQSRFVPIDRAPLSR